MKQYYYINSQGQQVGPVDIDVMLNSGITPQTLIWTEGMQNWMSAGQVPELAIHFNVPPQPPVTGERGSAPRPERENPLANKPSTYMWLAVITTVLCCLPFGIVSIVYASKVDTAWLAGEKELSNDYSKKAFNWAMASLFSALIIGVIYGVVIATNNRW